MSPTAIFSQRHRPCTSVASRALPVGVGGGVPGVVGTGMAGWVSGRAIPVPTRTLPDDHIELNLALRPYLRPNEANFSVLLRFLRLGLR